MDRLPWTLMDPGGAWTFGDYAAVWNATALRQPLIAVSIRHELVHTRVDGHLRGAVSRSNSFYFQPTTARK